MSLDISSSRIPATPRNKRLRYAGAGNVIYGSSSGGGGYVDTSNFVKLTGEESQTVEGSILATGDLIAYAKDGATPQWPLATDTLVGVISVGDGLSVDSNGRLSATGSGGGGIASVVNEGNGNCISQGSVDSSGKVLTLSKNITATTQADFNSHTGNTTVHITSTERSQWQTAYNNNHTHSNKSVIDGITSTKVNNWDSSYNLSHSHSNKSYLDNINQNLSTTSNVNFGSVKASSDVTAYSTGSGGSLPICTTAIAGCCIAGNGLSVDSSGRLSVTGGGGGNMTVSTTGSGNAITALTASESVLTATKATTFALNSDLTTHTSNTTIHTTSTEKSTWNGKQDKLTAGTNITISNNVISATGSGGSGAISKIQQYNNTYDTFTTYTNNIVIRSGYRFCSGSLVAGAIQSIVLWNVPSSALSVTASLCTDGDSSPAWQGYQLTCNVGLDHANSCYRITVYNPTTASINTGAIRIFYQALFNG